MRTSCGRLLGQGSWRTCEAGLALSWGHEPDVASMFLARCTAPGQPLVLPIDRRVHIVCAACAACRGWFLLRCVSALKPHVHGGVMFMVDGRPGGDFLWYCGASASTAVRGPARVFTAAVRGSKLFRRVMCVAWMSVS